MNSIGRDSASWTRVMTRVGIRSLPPEPWSKFRASRVSALLSIFGNYTDSRAYGLFRELKVRAWWRFS